MGTVYRALDQHTGEPCAMKVLREATEDHVRRFAKEAEVLFKLRHPRIVRYIAHGRTEDGQLFLAMEWLEGESLSSVLRKRALTPTEAYRLALGASEAVAFAHEHGVLHRDIKPGNLELVGGELERVKLLDFGLARMERSGQLTNTGELLGTPGYMSPEQARGDRPNDGNAVLAELRPIEGEVAAAVADMPEPAPATEALPSITVKEQRVMSLVLARLEGGAGHNGQPRMDALQAAVAPFGGQVDQLIDGTLLVTVASGAPAEQAARAGRCALAMRATLGRVPIAQAAGRGLLAGGALLGEAIDRAAGLLALEHADAIRLDDAAAAMMRERFDIARDEHGFVLRGTKGEDDYTRRLLGRQTKCVGRARELRNLEALFEECVAEPVARAVLVTAAAGVGKSRIRYELMRRLIDRGTVVDEDGEKRRFQIWLGRGDPMSAGSAFAILSSAIRHATGVRMGESLDLRRRKLMARVAKCIPNEEQQRVAEFLGELIGTPFDDEGRVQLRAARRDPMLMGDQMRRAFEDFVGADCRRMPLLLVLEDLHWGDLPSVSFTDSALRNHADEPLMVLAFSRPEVHDLFPKLWSERDLQEVRLSRLTRKASAKLVHQVLGDEVSDDVTERLVERAGGNAFYLEELIRAVAEGKGDKLPESVLAMVQTRLSELHGEARRVLRGASVFGQVFWKRGVSTLIGEKRGADLDDWLTDLEERELITSRPESKFPEEREYVFRHALLREAAYAALTENDRELGHRLAGRWLEAAGEEQAVVLAEHFERGGDAARAVRWYQRAAEQALEGNDLEAAVARAERGVTCGAEGEALAVLRLLQANAHRWRGEFAEMEERAAAAMQHLPKGESRWCKAVAEIAVACRANGNYDPLVKIGEELLRLKPLPMFEAAYTEAAARTAMMLLMIGWTKHGDALLSRVARAEPMLANTHPAVVAWIYPARAYGALFAGDPGTYLQLCDAAAGRFAEAGDLRSVANTSVHLGFAYIEVGAYREAEAALRDALAAAKRMGLHNVVASSLNNLGIALARLGELDEAVVMESQAIQLAATQGDSRVEGGSRHYLATIHMLRGELSHAEAEATAAAEMLRVAPPLRAHALATLGQVRLAQSRVPDALGATHEAMSLLESLGGIEEGEASVRLAHAEALFASGDTQKAHSVIAVAVSRLVERAQKIREGRWRNSFLNQVPDNARTLSLAHAWVGQDGAAEAQKIVDESTEAMDEPASKKQALKIVATAENGTNRPPKA